MAITLAQLKTFVAVEGTGSIKGAAGELMVTQPSVSAAIASLEKELGVRLVERDGRGVRLSPAGETFAPFASRTLALLEEGRSAAVEAADPEQQELRIAAVNTAGEYIAPPILQAFRRRHPRIGVSVEVSNRARVFHRVGMREADIGIGGSPPEDGSLDGLPFLENELVIIVPPESLLASRKGLTLADLEELPWLLREEGSGTRAFTLNLLENKGISPSTMTLGSNGAIKQAVRTGLGVSLQSRQAVALELATGMLREASTAERLPTRQWFALYPKEAGLRPAAEAFLHFLTGPVARQAISESLMVPAASG